MTIFPGKESFRCLPLALWDDDRRRLVGFPRRPLFGRRLRHLLAIGLVVARRKYEEK
jgi:hypothetical protein